MAIGFTPRYSTAHPLDRLTQAQFLVLAIEAGARLNWQFHHLSNTGIVAVSTLEGYEATVKISNGNAIIDSISAGNPLTGRRTNKKHVAQFLEMLNELKETIPAEYLAAKYEELLPFLPPPEADMLLQPGRKERSQAADLLAIFKPAKDYFITPIILNLNLLLFLLMALSGVSIVAPDAASLMAWGANFGPLTRGGEWWRLITCCFLHIGFTHLVMNMYAFLLIGAQLEPRIGRLRFLSAYLLTGIVASFTSLWWHDHTISAGASGAIFGMYGVFLALLTTDLVEKRNRKQLLASIVFFVIYNLLGGLKEGIDNAAHLGGLVAGLIIGYSFVPHLKKAAPAIVKVEVPSEIPDYY